MLFIYHTDRVILAKIVLKLFLFIDALYFSFSFWEWKICLDN